MTCGSLAELEQQTTNELHPNSVGRPVFVLGSIFVGAHPRNVSRLQFPSTVLSRTTPQPHLAIDIHDLCGSKAMGIWDTITDLVEAATPWSTVEAEAPSSNPAGAGPAKESAVRHPTHSPSKHGIACSRSRLFLVLDALV